MIPSVPSALRIYVRHPNDKHMLVFVLDPKLVAAKASL